MSNLLAEAINCDDADRAVTWSATASRQSGPQTARGAPVRSASGSRLKLATRLVTESPPPCSLVVHVLGRAARLRMPRDCRKQFAAWLSYESNRRRYPGSAACRPLGRTVVEFVVVFGQSKHGALGVDVGHSLGERAQLCRSIMPLIVGHIAQRRMRRLNPASPL
jgi:hypothetical protein